jgi:hypothetical protein
VVYINQLRLSHDHHQQPVLDHQTPLNNSSNYNTPKMKVTAILFSAVAMLAATVAATPAPNAEAIEAKEFTFDVLEKR